MPTGVYNADGSAGGRAHGPGDNAPAEAVYVGGPCEIHVYEAASSVKPGAVVVMDGTGKAAEAAAGATGPFLGIAMERTLYQDVDAQDGGSVLDAYAAGEEVPVCPLDGMRFACAADGAITKGSQVEVGAVSGSVRAIAAGDLVGVYQGKADAADTDRIIVRYAGGSS